MKALTSLTLYDYSDRELLFIIRDNETGEKEGYASTDDIAEALGIDSKHPGTHVGVRLAWLRRYDGVVDKHPKKPKLWRVSEKGEQLMNGRLTIAQQEMLAEADPGRLLMLTRALTQSYEQAPAFAGYMMGREWRRGTARNGAVRRVDDAQITGRARRVSTRKQEEKSRP